MKGSEKENKKDQSPAKPYMSKSNKNITIFDGENITLGDHKSDLSLSKTNIIEEDEDEISKSSGTNIDDKLARLLKIKK